MLYTQDELVKRIHDTKAVSIWNREKGPVFWYAANVPGPFYVNTEMVIGAELAARLLHGIDTIIAATDNAQSRAEQLNTLILSAYDSSESYQRLIATMIDRAKNAFASDNYSFLSGGERRDWLFSIPFAKAIGIKHAFIFKNKQIYCEPALKPQESGLHIADLINNAASYFDAWLPALGEAQLKCIGTVCVNSRGIVGVDRLTANGQKVVTLNSIDIRFFEKLRIAGLIDQETLDELGTYFMSPKEWADKYLMGNHALFAVKDSDNKSHERLLSFFTNDPWSLRPHHESFFADMQRAG